MSNNLQQTKRVIAMDSHTLSSFQRCEVEYKFTTIDGLEPKSKYRPFAIGTLVAHVLERYYEVKKALQCNSISKEDEMNTLHCVMEGYANAVREEDSTTLDNKFNDCLSDVMTIEKRDTVILANKLMSYHKVHVHEPWQIVAVEVGFSFILHEDEDYIFVYEGRPDMIVRNNGKLVVVDHKTRSMDKDLLAFNNQVLGYLVSTNAHFFVYNYFGLQTGDGPEKWFKRQPVMFSESQKEDWKEVTIDWYYRIAKRLDENKFIKSMHCDGKYGPCRYIGICSSNGELERQLVTEKLFKKREKKWSAWDDTHSDRLITPGFHKKFTETERGRVQNTLIELGFCKSDSFEK